jgi:hypothetical protein
MGVLRFFVALLLVLLAVGFGLCGLCVSVLGNSSDKATGLFLILLGLGAGIGGVALFRRVGRRPPPNDSAPRE